MPAQTLPTDRRARASAGPLARRPTLSTEMLLLLVCVYFTLLCNTQFWTALASGRSASWGTAAYLVAAGCALTGLHFLMLAPWLNRWTSRVLLGLLVLLATGANYYAAKFNVYYDPSMLRNILQTDVKEAAELLSPAMLLQILGLSLPALLLVFGVRLERRPPLRAVLRRMVGCGLAFAVLLLCLGSIFKDFSSHMRNDREVRYLITPAALIWSLGAVLGTDVQAAQAPRQPIATDAHLGPSWQAAAKPALLVFVVGETARAQNWGLNPSHTDPAPRDTTPQLAQRGVINFPDMHSCGTNTAVSLPCMFSLQGRRHYDEQAIRRSESLLHVLARAGLRVVWNENQSGCKGVCDRLETLTPSPQAFPKLCEGGQCMDLALLESAKPLVRDHTGNLVLFLHQMGNHGPAYFKRHPPAFRHFTPTCDTEDFARCSPQQIANSYDNALRYTDHVLAQTIDFLAGLQATHDTALIYVSDHGESLGENGIYLHGLPYSIAPKVQTHVPMVMWFSPGFAERRALDLACLQQVAQEKASHDHLFHTVLSLLDVRTQVHEASLDLTARCRPAG
ncbi:UNVERIFIED_ORG: lipid A ethanolaminephosphotransferase [Comamonas terrigena]